MCPILPFIEQFIQRHFSNGQTLLQEGENPYVGIGVPLNADALYFE